MSDRGIDLSRSLKVKYDGVMDSSYIHDIIGEVHINI